VWLAEGMKSKIICHPLKSKSQGRQKLFLECINQWQEFSTRGKKRAGDQTEGLTSRPMSKKEASISKIPRYLYKTSTEASRAGSLPTSSVELTEINSSRWGRYPYPQVSLSYNLICSSM
jgi:hypothetical protein